MAINIRDLGGGSTVGIYRPYQRPKKETNTEEETINTTPENNPSNDTLGTVAGVATTLNNGAKLYERLNGENITTSGVGNSDTDSITSGRNVGDFETPELDYRYSVTQDLPKISVDNQEMLSFVNEHYDNLGLQNFQNQLTTNDPNTITLDGLMSGKQTPYTYNVNGNKAEIKLPGFRSDDGVVGARDLGSVGLDWWTARNVALPVLQYAAQYKSLDTKGRWIQSGKTLQQIMQGFAGKYEGTNIPAKTILDDYYISNFVDIADMTTNWSSRSHFSNALTASNAALNMIKNFGWDEYIGGKEVLGNAYDSLSLLNFGSSLYHLTNDWSKLNDLERTAATVQTMLAGMQAYDGGTSLIKAFSAAADVATPATNSFGITFGKSAANAAQIGLDSELPEFGRQVAADTTKIGLEGGVPDFNAGLAQETMGEEVASGTSMLSTVGYGLQSVLGAYTMYKGIEGLYDSFGNGSAANRKIGAMSGAAAGAGGVMAVSGGMSLAASIAGTATVGSVVPVVGTVIGAVVGAAVGVAMNSVKSGKSHEQRARDNWRQAYTDAGVFSKYVNPEGHHSMAMQLADGSWYEVGNDGSGSRATMKDGSVKRFANPDLVTGGSKVNAKGELSPYDVDYTNTLDFVGSLMMGGMIIPIGGSYQKNRSAEVPQMLGYMTNGITSNCGREFSIQNYNIMAANARAMYSRIGITDKTTMINCVSDAYFQGKLSKADYYNMLLSSNLIYDDNGYQQAQGLMASSGKAGMGAVDNTTGNAAAPEATGE